MQTSLQQVDLIYFTLFPWDNPYSSVSLSFTKEFAKTHRVFYVNPPFTLKDIIKNRTDERIKSRMKDQLLNRMRYENTPELSNNVIAVHPPSILPINWLPKGKTYNRLHQIDNEVIYKTIEKIIKDYNIQNYLYINCFNPFVGGVLPRPRFRPLLNIYQCIDDMMQEKYTAKHWAALEEQVIKASDITVVTSRQLHKLKSPLNPSTHILHNAVDDTIFKKALEVEYEKPAEIKNITTPIIGFTGNMDSSRIDYPLLKSIAMHHPDKTLVLVGPTNSDDYLKVGLDAQPNVIFTGSKNINDLPQYLQHFDALIIPFLCNKLTESIYPLKINEYLFSGKPVIATNFSEDIRSFGAVIYIADDHTSFNRAIEKSIIENNEQRKIDRVAVAKTNTWKNRVSAFWEIVEQHLEKYGQTQNTIR